ncbi:MAG: UDP-N-acetylglucosamine 2-epimerase (non-hydrolyzing) [Actinomycetota bacterium]|nr:UDP-N-acetylglucosamine 2-epimerase (non-hydrolyzing) [Actinomycetota bacterium]
MAVALAESGWARPCIVTTGQHGDVVRETLSLFDLKADIELAASTHTDGLVALTAALLTDVDAALECMQPTLVIVQGDTASTLAGAQAAFYRQIPVVHVEAGLRSFDLELPFPEEANRRMVSQLTRLHLAPTPTAVRNLRRENFSAADIVLTGNTVVDALLIARDLRAPYEDAELEALDASAAPLVVVTAHRRESWGEPIRQIGRAVATLSRAYPESQFVVASHMNSAVREVLEAELKSCPNVYRPGPIGYGPFVRLLARASLVITDSGGIQEEAPAFGVPVLVTREVTERTESIDAGVAKLVGTDEQLIVDSARRLLEDPAAYAAMARATNPYGDGRAAQRVADGCGWLLGKRPRPHDYPNARQI